MGLAFQVMTLPAAWFISTDLAWTDDDEALLLVALTVGGPAVIGFPTMAVGRLLRDIAGEGNDAFPSGFGRAKILRWPAALGVTMLTTCVRLMLTVVAAMLVIVGITYLFTGEELSLVNPVLGPAGDAILTAVIAMTLAAAAWMSTGVTIAGCLLVGYAIVLLFLRDTREQQLVTARMLLLAVLITVGICAVVITGEVEPDDRLTRGLIPTVGAALIVIPLAGVLTWAWRAGHRPAPLNSVGGWAILIVRLIAGTVLIGWLTVSVGSAWA
ncbi:hypothetical protein FB566_3295 [Stackebrandtia endophytica]|uniref:Uncharacterized protein n=1 Tax=Stackebrandtia endophytica TaxID=1496996 RepID=A0A543AYS0_9ACTN|nr:hypothetical protein FB566_3295 [Stackebrandtia endophytica]